MEEINLDHLSQLAATTINQNGRGMDMDRYIYTQAGSGFGSLLGNLLRAAVPFLKSGIKATARIAKPHLVSAGKDLIKAGAKRGLEEIAKKSVEKVHQPHKRRKW